MSNVQAIRDMFAAYGRGDLPSVLNELAEDVVWDVPGPASVPSTGRRTGREQVEHFFRVMAETVDRSVFEPREFVAEADKVVVIGHTAGRARTTGREYASDFVMIFRFRNGKVAGFQEFLDTAQFAEAFDTRAAGARTRPGSA